MQESARYRAVLDIISEVFEDVRPADNIINEYMRARKYIGSKDRRFIIDTSWDIIRNRCKLTFDIGSKDPRNILICYLKDKKLEELFDNSKYGLSFITEQEVDLLNNMNEDVYPLDIELETPEWLYNKIKDEKLLRSLNGFAPADFRVNVKSRERIIDDLGYEGYEVESTPYSPIGIRLRNRINLSNCVAYQEGKIEVQDEGSQILSILCDVKANNKIVDYCAGAGGKSLALSYLLNNEGSIDAHDIDWHRLEQIKPRMDRAKVRNIEIKREITDTDYDRFIIDAPCSGTGTWRRSPDSKFRLTVDRLKELNRIQYELLEKAYRHTKSGGRIIYMTCSVLKDENEDIVVNFLNQYKDVSVLNINDIWENRLEQSYPCEDDKMLRLSPYSTNTDGFFMAVLIKD